MEKRRLDCLLLLVLALLPVWSFAWPIGHTSFVTEPSFTPLVVNVTTNKDPSALAPGYIFLTPNGIKEGFRGGYGLHIFDIDGELIWYGNDTADGRALRGHVCDYLGEKTSHICWHDGPRVFRSHSDGVIRFFDQTYQQVGQVHGGVGGLQDPDGHEVNTADDGKRLLQDVFNRRYLDESYPTQGYTVDACFQDVDLETGELQFQWCAMDYLPICNHTTSNKTADKKCWSMTWMGGGGTKGNPWDFWHMNSVDKNPDGDYLVSIRHIDTVLKIAGNDNVHDVEPGTVLWTLNGEHGNIKQENFNFSAQHVARFVNTTSTTTTFTLLNNALSGSHFNQATAEWSAALLVEVNNVTKTARQLVAYENPDKMLSESAGNVHMQSNGNIFVGWGHLPNFSEFDQNGTLLYHGSFVGDSPQAWKYPWVGKPNTKPKIVVYARGCSSPLFAYASWNGATELKFWEIYASNRSEGGPWNLISASTKKTSFETQFRLGSPALYFHAKAYDSAHNLLAESAVAELFVPNKTQRAGCQLRKCREPERFDYDAQWSESSKCTALWSMDDNTQPGKEADPAESKPTGKKPSHHTGLKDAVKLGFLALVLAVAFIETVAWTMNTTCWPWYFGRRNSPAVYDYSRLEEYGAREQVALQPQTLDE